MFPNNSECKFKNGYRVQLPPDGHWSEWKSLDDTEWLKNVPLVLSVQFKEDITKDHPEYKEYQKFWQENFNG